MGKQVITANEYYRRAASAGMTQNERLRLVLHENQHPQFWVTVKGIVDFDSIADRDCASKGVSTPKRQAYGFVVAFQSLTRGEFEAMMVEQFKQALPDADNFQSVARQLMERDDKVVVFRDDNVLAIPLVEKALREYGCDDADYDPGLTGPGLPDEAVIQRFIKENLLVEFMDDNLSGFRQPVSRRKVRVLAEDPGL